MLSTHWRERNALREHDFRFFDVLSRLAADLIERTQASDRLRESEARQRALIEGVPQLVWRAVDGGTWTWVSPQWLAYTGQTEADSLGQGWLDVLHPDDRAGVIARWSEAEHTGAFAFEYRLRHFAEDRYRWFQSRATPVRDEDDRIIEWLGTSTDVDDLRAMQDRQQVLVAELQHRTRNLLGVVHSIAGQTMRTSETLTGFKTAFNNRLGALSRVQGLLSHSESEPVTLDSVLHAELDALGAALMPERVVMRGPPVRLRKHTVETFALALHELATNARKYGALANDRGRLHVSWRTYADEAGRRLSLDWHEIDLDRESEVQSPVTQSGGYGRELIERALPYALQARTTYELGDTDLRCTIDLPLGERAASEER
jgi:two-component system, chemotaxis family, CheB/CheR fusion protein